MSNKLITPVRPSDFKLIQHSFNRHSVVLPSSHREILEDPSLWVNVANKMSIGDEVRILAEDLSWVAEGVCTYSQGQQAKVRIIGGADLDVVNNEEGIDKDESEPYFVKLRGPLKWCIMDRKSGDCVRDRIASQEAALKEMNELIKILRS